MKYIFVDESWEDYMYWQKTNPKRVLWPLVPDGILPQEAEPNSAARS